MTQQIVNQLVAEVEKQLHGPMREQMLQKLEASPTADTVAEAAHNTVMAIDGSSDAPIELDILLAVVTETIDMMVEVMEAMGIEMNSEEMREEALMKVIILHMESIGDDPEQKAVMQEILEEMMADGTLDEGMNTIASRADQSHAQMAEAGVAMAAPQQKPLAAGIKQGLMG